MVAETKLIDLFSFARDVVVNKWLQLIPLDGSGFAGGSPHSSGTTCEKKTLQATHLCSVHPMLRIIFNYQMGQVAEEEAAELLYSALYCRDRALAESIIRKKVTNLNASFKEFPYNTSKGTNY